MLDLANLAMLFKVIGVTVASKIREKMAQGNPPFDLFFWQ